MLSLPTLIAMSAFSTACTATKTKSTTEPAADTDATSVGDTSEAQDTASAPLEPDTAVLDTGTVLGTEADNGALAFLGIPFAAAPLGALRFLPPQPPASWSEPLVADTYAPPCMQYDSVKASVRGDEDCLYLNVWRPPTPDAAGLPVLVFVHGGGNVTGSAVEETAPGVILYDGAPIAVQEEAVVVTLQYRLNAFGYLADASLDTDEPSGNYGLRDQVAALEWAQRNIAAFGGDPDRILLFGESGGATDVCALLTVPTAAGLFQQAAVMSGGCGGKAREGLLEKGAEAAEAVGCTDAADRAACLRAADPEALVRAVQQPSTATGLVTTWAGPTIDGVFLPSSPLAAIEAGQHHHVPLMIGITADETSSPLFGVRFTLTEAQYESTVRAAFPIIADLVLAQYPLDDFDTPRDALVALTTDVQFGCHASTVAAAAAAWGPVYHYVYDHAYDGEYGGVFHPRWYGAAHGFELPLLFQTLETYDDYVPSGGESKLSRELSALWSNFAASGVPADSWPTYNNETTETMVLSTSSAVTTSYRAEMCQFWNQF